MAHCTARLPWGQTTQITAQQLPPSTPEGVRSANTMVTGCQEWDCRNSFILPTNSRESFLLLVFCLVCLLNCSCSCAQDYREHSWSRAIKHSQSHSYTIQTAHRVDMGWSWPATKFPHNCSPGQRISLFSYFLFILAALFIYILVVNSLSVRFGR